MEEDNSWYMWVVGSVAAVGFLAWVYHLLRMGFTHRCTISISRPNDSGRKIYRDDEPFKFWFHMLFYLCFVLYLLWMVSNLVGRLIIGHWE